MRYDLRKTAGLGTAFAMDDDVADAARTVGSLAAKVGRAVGLVVRAHEVSQGNDGANCMVWLPIATKPARQDCRF